MKRLQKISIVGAMIAVMLLGKVAAQRLLPGQKGILVTVGMPISEAMPFDKNNCSVSVGFTSTTKHRNSWLYELSYNRKGYTYRSQTVPVEDLLAEGGFLLNVLTDGGKNILVNIGLSAVVGYEIMNESKSRLFDGAKLLDEDNWVYGVGGQLSIEGFLSDNWLLFARAKTVALWGTDLGQFRPQLSVGIRVLF